MTALAKERAMSFERWNYKEMTLASGNKAYKGGIACLDLSTGKVEPGHIESDLLYVGNFAETVDATAADKLVNIRFPREIEVIWYENAPGGDAVLAANVGSLCYLYDDQTVTITPTGASVAGRVWAVSATDGVAVERLSAVPNALTSLTGLLALETAAPAFAANDCVIANNPNSGAILDVPTTAGASTITLPATAVEGTILYFVADGTKNGHTVQYRDATGPANLTTALTASKRHTCICLFLNNKWYANAYVSP